MRRAGQPSVRAVLYLRVQVQLFEIGTAPVGPPTGKLALLRSRITKFSSGFFSDSARYHFHSSLYTSGRIAFISYKRSKRSAHLVTCSDTRFRDGDGRDATQTRGQSRSEIWDPSRLLALGGNRAANPNWHRTSVNVGVAIGF